MSLRVYRVCRARYSRLDGVGAARVGGRWNSPGRAVVYMAESVSLAVLENLVHMPRQDFPLGYVCVTAELPDHIEVASESQVRREFDLEGAIPAQVGDAWLAKGQTAVLSVPSVVVPSERLYLLNPASPLFSHILVMPPALFHFDPRLFG